MRIEQISKNKIKCTITKRDLKMGNLTLLDFLKGSLNAKALLSVALREASERFGATPNNTAVATDIHPNSEDIITMTLVRVDVPGEKETTANEGPDLSVRIFSFYNLETAILASAAYNSLFHLNSSFYKEPQTGEYYLSVKAKEGYEDDFERSCAQLLEYSVLVGIGEELTSYLREHCIEIINENAIEALASIA